MNIWKNVRNTSEQIPNQFTLDFSFITKLRYGPKKQKKSKIIMTESLNLHYYMWFIISVVWHFKKSLWHFQQQYFFSCQITIQIFFSWNTWLCLIFLVALHYRSVLGKNRSSYILLKWEHTCEWIRYILQCFWSQNGIFEVIVLIHLTRI